MTESAGLLRSRESRGGHVKKTGPLEDIVGDRVRDGGAGAERRLDERNGGGKIRGKEREKGREREREGEKDPQGCMEIQTE